MKVPESTPRTKDLVEHPYLRDDGSVGITAEQRVESDWDVPVPENQRACSMRPGTCTMVAQPAKKSTPSVPEHTPFTPQNIQNYQDIPLPFIYRNMSSYQAFKMSSQLHGRPIAETGTLVYSTNIQSSVPSESIRFSSEWHLDTGYYFMLNRDGGHVETVVVCHHACAPNFVTSRADDAWCQWNPLKFPMYAETYDYTSSPAVLLHFVCLSNSVDCGEYRLLPTPVSPDRPLVTIHLTRQETPFGYPTSLPNRL